MLKSERRPEMWTGHHVFLLETTLPAGVVSAWLRTAVAKLDPTAPVEIETLTESVTKLADRPRFEAALLSLFAGCGLLMAVIGLYGVIAYIAAQRTQEIGVRMALGANRMDILRLIAMEGVRLIAIGGSLGFGAALATGQMLRGLIFHVGPRDPASYFAVAALLGGVALAATLIPAISATQVHPGAALRCE
jgi:ABC-type antimicrobial peptide transport system permease subunit